MPSVTWTDPGYEAVARLLGERTGLTFAPHRCDDAESGIGRAMAKAGVANLGKYLALLREERVPVEDLVAEVVVGETYFFRDPGQFEFIRREALPAVARLRGPEHVLRAWSAGCASGEEAYSLAMLLDEEGWGGRASVLATDISRSALAKARQAAYGQWSFRGCSVGRTERYFRKAGDRLVVNGNIRERVTIEVLNLALDHYPSLATGTWGMDLILCRNVFIYFDREATRQAGQRLLDALAEGGWLITGASDPPLAVGPPYEVVTNAAGIFYRRGEGGGPAAKRVRESPGRDFPYPPLYEGGEKNGWPLAGGLPALADQAEAGGAELAGPPSELTAGGPRSSIGEPATPSQTYDPLAAARETFAKGDYRTVLGLTSRHPADPEAAALRVRALANLRDAAEARRAAAEATARHPLSTELRFLYAVLLLGLGDDAAAAREMRHALYLDRSSALCHFTLASILRRGGDLAGAGRAYRNARALLAACPPQQIVPLADGERAGRLLEAAEAQLVLLESVPEGRP